MRIADAIQKARERFVESPTAALDAELLLMHVLGCTRAWLHTWSDKVLEIEQRNAFLELAARREQGEPIAYITGEREFFGRSFQVTPDTMIPRPDTEMLIEGVLDTLPSRPLKIADLGAGCGTIGLTLAMERPAWDVVLVERDKKALKVARDNARRMGATRVSFLESSWFEQVRGRFDTIVCNPPYIDEEDHHLQQGDLRFEPRSALASGEHGLADLRLIAEQARDHLNSCAWLVLEHGYNQGEAVTELLESLGYMDVYGYQDLAGNDRVTMGHV